MEERRDVSAPLTSSQVNEPQLPNSCKILVITEFYPVRCCRNEASDLQLHTMRVVTWKPE
jgi:hypothetical protein